MTGHLGGRGRFHVRAAVLPDGLEPVDLWISDGRFVAGPLDDAVFVDGSFVAPGLVDAHAHLSIPFADCLAHRVDPVIASGLIGDNAEVVLRNAAAQLRTGVLAVRDAGFVQQLALDSSWLPERPVVVGSGWIVVPANRYFPGVAIGKDTEADELIDRVRETAATGLGWFKIIADFPGADFDLFAPLENYPIDVIRLAVEVAHGLGMRVMAHSTGPFVAELVNAGVDSIEHGCSVTPEIIESMAAHGACWVPTAATVEQSLLMAESVGGPPEPRKLWTDRMTKSLALAVQLGVPVMVGSDELPHGYIVDEMSALVRLGMSPQEVIAAATTVARKVLGLPGTEVGAPADLVVWHTDPRNDITHIAHPSAVFASGRLISLDASQ
jgi:imidazolonepropionase-like amidohydrolase